MEKMSQRVSALRFRVQALSLLALHSSWGPEFKWLCNPVLSCHSCALAWFACPIGVFIHYASCRTFPFLAAGTLLFIGALIGRLFCGWVCPVGFLQDMLHRIPGPKFELPRWTAAGKFVVLALLVIALPLVWGETTAFAFCRICPASALQITVPYALRIGPAYVDGSIGVKLAVLVIVLGAVIFIRRAFCTVLCPIGALMAPLNFLSWWKVRAPARPCVSCRLCDKACPTAVSPSARISRGVPASHHLDCVVCHECTAVCGGRMRPAGAN